MKNKNKLFTNQDLSSGVEHPYNKKKLKNKNKPFTNQGPELHCWGPMHGLYGFGPHSLYGSNIRVGIRAWERQGLKHSLYELLFRCPSIGYMHQGFRPNLDAPSVGVGDLGLSTGFRAQPRALNSRIWEWGFHAWMWSSSTCRYIVIFFKTYSSFFKEWNHFHEFKLWQGN